MPNNENSESLFSFNIGLVESDPYGFFHSELGNNSVFSHPIIIDNSNIFELDNTNYPSLQTKKNNLDLLSNFSNNKDPITGISIESLNLDTDEILEEYSSFQNTNNYITIENKGNTDLCKDEEGFGYIKNSEEYIAI